MFLLQKSENLQQSILKKGELRLGLDLGERPFDPLYGKGEIDWTDGKNFTYGSNP